MTLLPYMKKTVLLIICILALDCTAASVHYWGTEKIVPDSCQWDAQAVVVFYGDQGQSSLNRLDAARKIWETHNPKPQILLVGGARPARDYYGSQWMAELLQQSGIAADDLVIDRTSFDTRTNLTALKRIVQELDIKTLLLVSDRLHLRRIVPLMKDRFSKEVSYRPCAAAIPNGLVGIWVRVHHEWVASIGYAALGEERFTAAMARLRDQD